MGKPSSSGTSTNKEGPAKPGDGGGAQQKEYRMLLGAMSLEDSREYVAALHQLGEDAGTGGAGEA